MPSRRGWPRSGVGDDGDRRSASTRGPAPVRGAARARRGMPGSAAGGHRGLGRPGGRPALDRRTLGSHRRAGSRTDVRAGAGPAERAALRERGGGLRRASRGGDPRHHGGAGHARSARHPSAANVVDAGTARVPAGGGRARTAARDARWRWVVGRPADRCRAAMHSSPQRRKRSSIGMRRHRSSCTASAAAAHSVAGAPQARAPFTCGRDA